MEIVAPARSLSHHPLFQVILTFQNSSDIDVDLPGLTVRDHPLEAASAKFDLSFALEEQVDDERAGRHERDTVEFATDLFDRETAVAVADRLERLLRSVTTDPSRPLSTLDVLSEEDRRLLLREWNDTARAVPDATLPELFQAQAAAHPASHRRATRRRHPDLRGTQHPRQPARPPPDRPGHRTRTVRRARPAPAR